MPRSERLAIPREGGAALAARLDVADHLLTDVGDARYVADVLAAWAGRYLCPTPPASEAPTPPASEGATPPKHEGGAGFDDPTVRVRIGGRGSRTETRLARSSARSPTSAPSTGRSRAGWRS